MQIYINADKRVELRTKKANWYLWRLFIISNFQRYLAIASNKQLQHQLWVSVHLLEKWRHFFSPKTLLCFRVWGIAVRDRMFLGMQGFDFAQILITFVQILLKFTQISHKFGSNLPKSNQFYPKKVARGCVHLQLLRHWFELELGLGCS